METTTLTLQMEKFRHWEVRWAARRCIILLGQLLQFWLMLSDFKISGYTNSFLIYFVLFKWYFKVLLTGACLRFKDVFIYSFIFVSVFYSVLCCCSVAKSCLTLCNPMDYSLSGSSVHRISQARIPSGLLCPPPGHLPDPGIKPTSTVSSALAGRFFSFESPGEPTLYYTREIIIC